MNQARENLKELSREVKELIKSNADILDKVKGDLTINNVILTLYYPTGEYKTFKGWKDENRMVNKGEKGFPIWGRKRKFTSTKDDETIEYQSFPIAYIFNKGQTHDIN